MTSLGRRWPTAISIASSTSSARRRFAIAQPTILRLQASSLRRDFPQFVGGLAAVDLPPPGLEIGLIKAPPAPARMYAMRALPRRRAVGPPWLPALRGVRGPPITAPGIECSPV